jgi:hypothetical protein
MKALPESIARLLLVDLLLIVSGLHSIASAETFGGWRFTAPPGFTATRGDDHIEFMKATAPAFCQLALYSARPIRQTPAAEAAFEWKNVIEKMFRATGIEPLDHGKSRSAVPYAATGASVSASGNSYYAILYVVTPPPVVSSIVVISNSRESMAQCKPAAQALLDSLNVDTSNTPAPTASAAKTAHASVAGRWATSAAGQPNDGSPSIRRQYIFAADGTYSYHSEIWAGAYRSNEWTLIDETGTWTVAGDQLTVNPASARGVVRSRQAVTKKFDVPLEKVTYTWRTHYLAGIQENNLVLTPPAKTKRDGEFAANDQFPSSYFLSAKYKPEWEFPL